MRPETPQNRPQYHRLRRIIAMVREGMAGGRLPNRSDFRRELEASPRTLARDLDFLRDEERAPIAYEPARHGYRLTDATYDLVAVLILLILFPGLVTFLPDLLMSNR
jgi:predicted DNA-binding transcriptional regulator YafY